MGANDRQIGGNHYKVGVHQLEHWDIIDRYRLGYLEGCITKYVARCWKKNGLEDLEKALHYMEKLIERVKEGRTPTGIVPENVVFDFCYGMSWSQTCCIFYVMRWQTISELMEAESRLRELILYDQIPLPGTPEDGGQHEGATQ